MQTFHFDPWPPPCSSKSIKVQSAPSSSNSKKNTEQHTHTHANITYLMAWSLDVTWACSLSKFNRSHLLGGRRLVQGCRFLAASLCHRSHFSDLQFLCQRGEDRVMRSVAIGFGCKVQRTAPLRRLLRQVSTRIDDRLESQRISELGGQMNRVEHLLRSECNASSPNSRLIHIFELVLAKEVLPWQIGRGGGSLNISYRSHRL